MAKVVKRAIALIVALALVMCNLVVASAADEIATYRVSTSYAREGDVVDVTVTLNTAAKIGAADYELNYNKSELQLVGTPVTSLIGGMQDIFVPEEGGIIKMSRANVSGDTGLKVVLSAQFKVLRKQPGESNLIFTVLGCKDNSLELKNIATEVENGKITVIPTDSKTVTYEVSSPYAIVGSNVNVLVTMKAGMTKVGSGDYELKFNPEELEIVGEPISSLIGGTQSINADQQNGSIKMARANKDGDTGEAVALNVTFKVVKDVNSDGKAGLTFSAVGLKDTLTSNPNNITATINQGEIIIISKDETKQATYKVSSPQGRKGENVTVVVSMDTAAQVGAGDYELTFLKDELKLIGNPTTKLPGATPYLNYDINSDPELGFIRLARANQNGDTGKIEILEATFEILKDGPSESELTLKVSDLKDTSLPVANDIMPILEQGKVIIKADKLQIVNPTFTKVLVPTGSNNAATAEDLGEQYLPTSGKVTLNGTNINYTIAWNGTIDTTTPGTIATFNGTITYTNVPEWAQIPEDLTVTREVEVSNKKGANIDITVPQDTVYGTDFTIGATATGEGLDEYSFTYEYLGTLTDGTPYGPTSTKPTQAGTYTVTATLVSDTHIGQKTVSFEIAKKPIDVTIENKTKLVGAQLPTLTFNFNASDLAYDDTSKDLAVTLSVIGYKDEIGTYTITGASTSNNYAVTFKNGVLTVSDKQMYPITLVAEPIKGGTATSQKTAYEAGETVTITATANTGYEFDKWEVVKGGVTLASTASPTTTFTMPAAEVEITAHFVVATGKQDQAATTVTLSKTTMNYGEQAPTATAGGGSGTGAYVNFASSNTQVATIDAATGVITIVGAGTTNITVERLGDSNYNHSKIHTPITLTVNKLTIPKPAAFSKIIIPRGSNNAATAEDLGEQYLPTSGSVTLNGTTINYTIAWSGTIDTTTPGTIVTFNGTLTYTNAPQWAQAPSDLTVTREVEVSDKRAATVTMPNVANITYGETLVIPAATATGEGLSNPSFKYEYSGILADSTAYGPTETKPTQAGAYTVTAILISSTHAGQSEAKQFTINPKSVTLNKGSLVVTTKFYDGNTAAQVNGSVQIIGLLSGDAVSVTGGNIMFPDKNAGIEKQMVASGFSLTGAGSKNYVLSSQQIAGLTGTINKKPITVTIDNKTKLLGAALPALTFTFDSKDLVSGETAADLAITLKLEDKYEDKNGTYAITGTSASNNYAVEFKDGVLTVSDKLIYPVTLTAEPTQGGTVATYKTAYEVGETVTITATANTGYVFDKWEVVKGGVTVASTTSAITTFTMPAAEVAIKAIFKQTTIQKYTVTLSSTEGGTASGGGEYEVGGQVTISATPNSGYYFTGWTVISGNVTLNNANNIATFTMPAQNVAIRANFAKSPTTQYEVKLTTSGSGTVTGAGKYTAGQTVNIAATPSSGFYFVDWVVTEGNVSLVNRLSTRTSFVMPAGNVTIRANFRLQETSSGGGSSSGSSDTYVTPPYTPSPGDTKHAQRTKSTHNKNGLIEEIDVEGTLGAGNIASGKVEHSSVVRVLEDVKKYLKPGEYTELDIYMIPVGNAKGYSVEILRPDFQDIIKAKLPVKIKTELGYILFDVNALKHILNASTKGNILITIAQSSELSLTSKSRETIGDKPVLDFIVKSGENVVTNLNNKGKAEIGLRYKARKGEELSAIITNYVNPKGELEVVKNGKYVSQTEHAVLKTETLIPRYAASYNPVVFSDVSKDSVYYDAVLFAAARSITSGTSKDTFSPAQTLTRAQFTVLLMNAYEIAPDAEPKNNFDDAGDDYYTPYLSAAKRLGISAGVGNNMFAPNKELTNQEMYTLLYNALKVIKKLPETKATRTIDSFGDSDEIADWAKTAMKTLVESKVIGLGTDKLYPTSEATRAKMVQTLYTLLNL